MGTASSDKPTALCTPAPRCCGSPTKARLLAGLLNVAGAFERLVGGYRHVVAGILQPEGSSASHSEGVRKRLQSSLSHRAPGPLTARSRTPHI